MPSLFEQLRNAGEQGLQDLIEQRQQEHVQLDFKQKKDASRPSLNDDDRRTLGEALSGFSNSAGGLLIWGVDARKQDGIDCATSLVPIQDIEAFQTNVTSLIGHYLIPRHEGIRTAVIQCEGQPGRGYLLLEVERSERRPHRSEVSGKRVYFKRVGDSFFEMEHYDIEDAFKRVHVPELAFRFKLVRNGGNDNDAHGGIAARLYLRLANTSRMTAKFPYLFVRDVGSHVGLANLIPYSGYRQEHDDKWIRAHGGADAVINPETSATIFSSDINVEIPPNPAPYLIAGRPAHQFELLFEYRFGCEDSRIQGSLFQLFGDDIVRLLGLPPRAS